MNFLQKFWSWFRGLFSRTKEKEPEELEDMTEGVWLPPATSPAKDLEEVMKSLEFWKFAEADMQPKLPYVNPDKERLRHCYRSPKHRRR